jgi:2-haloacid dehalogenase
MRKTSRSIAIFDIGGVLIDWNPRYMYRKLFGSDEAAMERFLSTICTQSWNEQQDAGRTFAEGSAFLKKVHPGQSELIDAWFLRYEEMLGGPIAGSVAILEELKAGGVPLYALSNWSTETFPVALRLFSFLHWFQGVLLSGEARILKPDRRLFQLLLQRYTIDPSEAVYVDDHVTNVDAARQLGMYGIHFTSSATLRDDLAKVGLLQDRLQG